METGPRIKRGGGSPIVRCVGVWVLLLVGSKIWLGPGLADIGRPPQVFAGLLAILLACVPALNRAIGRTLGRLQKWQMPWWVPLVLGIGCTVYCAFSAWHQGRSFRTLWNDDSCYEIQARMMAMGRLWMPAHPVADSFDSPYLFVRPVYASIYFPGTALLLAPAALAHLPIVIIPLLVTGAIAAMFCRIVTELIDPAAGLLAPLLWVSSMFTRRFAITPMSHPPVILMFLIAVWAWLRWRGDPAHRLRWALLGGAAVGWGAIMRPLDALCLLGPLMLVAMWELRTVVLSRRISLLSIAFLWALPFLVLMAVQDWGVTGHWWEFPHEVYVRTQCPGLEFGFHKYDPNAEPSTMVQQKIDMYDQYIKKQLLIHTPGNVWPEFWLLRLPRFLSQVIPVSLIVILAVLGVAGITNRALAVFTLPVILLPIALSFYPWIPDHYPMVVWPATCVLALLGTRQIGWLVPPAKSALMNAATLLLVALAIGSLPEFDRSFHDDVDETPLQTINRALDALPNEPALVLFRYAPPASFFYEPVYNTDVAWPDDARIVRAHDLGPAHNAKLFSYYAAIQPQRTVYLYDRAANTLARLGSVVDLSKQGQPSRK